MTLDREVRLTPLQIIVTQRALRAQVKIVRRSIAKAEANLTAGVKIQRNVHESNREELAALELVLEALEVARKAIARHTDE